MFQAGGPEHTPNFTKSLLNMVRHLVRTQNGRSQRPMRPRARTKKNALYPAPRSGCAAFLVSASRFWSVSGHSQAAHPREAMVGCRRGFAEAPCRPQWTLGPSHARQRHAPRASCPGQELHTIYRKLSFIPWLTIELSFSGASIAGYRLVKSRLVRELLQRIWAHWQRVDLLVPPPRTERLVHAIGLQQT